MFTEPVAFAQRSCSKCRMWSLWVKLGSVHLAEHELGSLTGHKHACVRDCVEHVVDAFDPERAIFFVRSCAAFVRDSFCNCAGDEAVQTRERERIIKSEARKGMKEGKGRLRRLPLLPFLLRLLYV